MRGFQASGLKVAEHIPLKTAFCRFHDNDYPGCTSFLKEKGLMHLAQTDSASKSISPGQFFQNKPL